MKLPGTFAPARPAWTDAGLPEPDLRRKFGDTFSAGASAIFAIQRFEGARQHVCAIHQDLLESYFTTGTPKQRRTSPATATRCPNGFGASVGLRWQPTDMFSSRGVPPQESMSDWRILRPVARGRRLRHASLGQWLALQAVESSRIMFDVQEISTDVARCRTRSSGCSAARIFDPVKRRVRQLRGGKKGPGSLGRHDHLQARPGPAVLRRLDLAPGYSYADQRSPGTRCPFNILPGRHGATTGRGLPRDVSGNEVNLSFMFGAQQQGQRPNNFDPSQTVQLRDEGIELELSYAGSAEPAG